jgi:hypothetical protein
MRNHNLRSSRFRRTALECAAALALVVSSTAAAQAFTPEVGLQVRHFIECFGFMITDPAMHQAECSPGKPGVYDSTSDIGPASPRIRTTYYEPPYTTVTTTAQ